ncbi:MAG: 50S ribosomal protein L22 [Candidatus Komeilibacteria bacterium]|nr:50S ribosomal protein L22 [Candidatus Komeilibacteria bacterium]
MSPKKVRLVAGAIKGLSAEDALARLQFIHKAPSPILAKLVRSALANARHNNNLTDDLMMVKSIIVEEGVALKRWKPAAFGSAHPYKKRASHVRLVLGLKAGAKLPKGIVESSAAAVKDASNVPAEKDAKQDAKKEPKLTEKKPARTPLLRRSAKKPVAEKKKANE